jgi:hypothetical protein
MSTCQSPNVPPQVAGPLALGRSPVLVRAHPLDGLAVALLEGKGQHAFAIGPDLQTWRDTFWLRRNSPEGLVFISSLGSAQYFSDPLELVESLHLPNAAEQAFGAFEEVLEDSKPADAFDSLWTADDTDWLSALSLTVESVDLIENEQALERLEALPDRGLRHLGIFYVADQSERILLQRTLPAGTRALLAASNAIDRQGDLTLLGWAIARHAAHKLGFGLDPTRLRTADDLELRLSQVLRDPDLKHG